MNAIIEPEPAVFDLALTGRNGIKSLSGWPSSILICFRTKPQHRPH
jgi:hypothetical protein